MSEQTTEREVISRARLHPAEKTTPEARRAELLEGICSVSELADALGVGWRSIYDWMHRGLPSIRVGNKRLFNLATVRQWILSREADRSPRPVGRPRSTRTAREKLK